MIQGVYSATAGMINQQISLEVITNNLANASTSGYKRDELSFSSMLNTLPSVESIYPEGTKPELDTVTVKYSTDFSQSGVKSTDNPLDLALEGDGFFVIQHPNGIRYTRDGNFFLNDSGQLVTADGYPVLGTNGPINIQNGKLDIDSSGQVILDKTPIANLRLADFQDKSVLVKEGNNVFALSDPNATETASSALVRQGYLELSNVNVVQEMTKMIETMRVYESYQKSLQLINETLEKASGELGKISV
ncbi:flagellar basal-body rod protein FlgF [Candidatus Poribacteria bacterium]|nr:flagellar basal-body rod protein FlgF [Candidatus Poribacteria bacterium]